MQCDKCGHELKVGDYPFCKGGHGPMRQAIQTNEQFIGGVTIENMGDTPVTVYSREEYKQAMESRGLEQKIKYVPGDKYLTNWAAGIDAQTLENARVLMSRCVRVGTEADPAALQTFQPHSAGERR